MGGAVNQTTINNGVLQVYGAANDPTIKGGRLIVEKDGIAVFAVGNDSNLLIVFYVQIMPDDFVMQLHRF